MTSDRYHWTSKGGTGMFRGMTDEQRSKIDRSLEHHKAIETYPYTDKGGRNWVIFVDCIDQEDDNIKKYFALLDDEGIPVRPPFCPSPYSGDRDLKDWIEAGRPDDPEFQISNTARKLKLKREQISHEYRPKGDKS